MNCFSTGRWPRCVHHLGAADAGRKRKAPCNRFAETNQIWHHLTMLAREPFPGAPKPGIDLIQNQKSLMLIAQTPQPRQEFERRDINAAAHLNWLNENGTNALATENLANF